MYEPFGLAPIEAAASGLAPVVTENGDASEIFADGSGILVDPVSSISISKGLLDGLSRYNELSKAAMKSVKEFYTWERTAARYLSVIKDSLDAKDLHSNAEMPVIDDTIRITEYLTDKV